MLSVKQKEHIGVGSLQELPKILLEIQAKKIFLVTGKKSYSETGIKEALSPYIRDYQIIHFDDFSVNPSIKDVEKGIEIFKNNKLDTVIAIGGGSAIDTAKAVNLLAVNDFPASDILKGNKKIINKGKKLIAIPTTSGTGSEATSFAVIYIDKVKYSLDHQWVLPDVAIIDPELTYSLPSNISAASGIDALGQAIEGYWSIKSTAEAKRCSKEAIKLIIDNLVRVIKTGDKQARLSMAQAANLSGKSINISKTTASHAMSYALTSYFNILHGHAVGLTLSSLLVYNSELTDDDVTDSRGKEYVQKTVDEICDILGASDTFQAKEIIDSLLREVGLETKLSNLGLSEQDLDGLAKKMSNNRAGNNPRRFTQETAREIYYQIL